jgi:hypothetical protein
MSGRTAPEDLHPSDPRRSRPLSLWFVWGGVATATWDLAGVDIAGRTLKLTTVLFLVAATLRLVEDRSVVRWATIPARTQRVIALTAALLGWMAVRALFTGDIVGSLGGFAAQLIPAGAAFVAVWWHRPWVSSIVRAFVYGMAAISVAAVYEVFAKHHDLPWPTDYRARVGDTFRAAGFSFEAAYYAAPAVAAILICLAWWPRLAARIAIITVLVAGIIAASARIPYVQVALALVLFAGLALFGRSPDRRKLVVGLVGVIVLAAVGLQVASLLSPSPAETAPTQRATSIFDSSEPTSNAPRIEQTERVIDIIRDNPVVGLGPGQLADEYRERGISDPSEDAEAVTNNIWTQVMIDGGAIGLVLQAGVVVAVLLPTRRTIAAREASVLAAWITLVIAAGLTVSNFWDTEPWLLLGCYLGLMARVESEPSGVAEPVDEQATERVD